MPEITRLSGSNDWIDLGFVERERTPECAMRLGIQMRMAELSLSNIISVIDTLGVQRSRKAVHDWVQKADLQPDGGESPNQVALDESVIRINDQQYWLYAAVDPETNKFLHVRLFSTYTTGSTEIFLHEIREKHDVDDVPRTACSSRGLARRVLRTPCFSSMTLTGSKQLSNDTASISGMNSMEIATVSNVSFKR